MELILPRPAEERRRVFKCFCGTRFPLDQRKEFVRHTKSCTRRHEGEIQEGAHKRQNNGFLSPSDKELYQHIRRGGN